MRVALATLALLVALAPGAARALPAATTLAHCDVGGGHTLDDPSSCSLGTSDTVSVSLTTSPFVGLAAEAFSPAAAGIHGAGGSAILRYSFQVTGGNPGDVVPVLIAVSLEANGSSTSLSNAFGSLTVSTGAAGLATLVAVCNDGTCGGPTSFSGTVATRARSGDLNDFIELQVQAGTTGNAAAAESARASADPFLFIDPSFPSASLYGIEVSPGVANVAPEPGVAALLGLGALSLAASSRGARRRS